MAPSFPGMNPYLENPSLWSEVHSWLIVELARLLNPSLVPKYRAAVEKQVYLDALLVGIPDASVFQQTPESEPSSVVTTGVLSKPIPQFLLPLESRDEEPVVNLSEVLRQVYQEAALDLAIDYSVQPVPPLSESDFQWIQLLMES